MEDWLRLTIGTDGSDDCVHVDAKTGEVHHGLHSTNASNCRVSLDLVRVVKIHDILRCSKVQELYSSEEEKQTVLLNWP
jgi:hypothetical protein